MIFEEYFAMQTFDHPLQYTDISRVLRKFAGKSNLIDARYRHEGPVIICQALTPRPRTLTHKPYQYIYIYIYMLYPIMKVVNFHSRFKEIIERAREHWGKRADLARITALISGSLHLLWIHILPCSNFEDHFIELEKRHSR